MNTNPNDSNNEERVLVDQSQIKEIVCPTIDQIMEGVNKFDYFKYPPSMEQAEIHRQCYYICPDQYVLTNYNKDACECCNKKLNRKPYSWIFGDIYEAVVDEYGLAIPIYFTLLKFQLLIFIIVFCIYGISFIVESKKICDTVNTLNCDSNTDQCHTCQFVDSYLFIDIINIQEYLHSEKGSEYQWFQTSAFLIFLIDLHLSFFYDLLITYIQAKYWHRDPYHSQVENSKSILIRHLTTKLEPNEIFALIKSSMQRNPNPDISSQANRLDNPEYEEIVYLYNTLQVGQLQKKRELLIQDIVIIAQQMKELDTNQKIITYKEEEVKIYPEYTKNKLLDKMIKTLQSLQEISNQIQKCSPSEINTIDDKSINLDPIPFSHKAIIQLKDPQLAQLIIKNFAQPWYRKILIRFGCVEHPKIINKITVKKSLRINGLYWENLGFRSEERVAIKIKSMLIMLVACAALMTAYEFIYLYKYDPQYQMEKSDGKLSIGQRVLTNIFTILVPIITTIAILVVIINQKQSRKNTFAHLERSFMHALIIVNYFLVTFVPYIFTYEIWNGKLLSSSVYDLVTLTQNKIITKNIFHTFHIRYMGYISRKRKLAKSFKEYFQGQLNSLMTPPMFPLRSRVCNAMYSLTVGLCLVYVCPLITLISFAFNCYIYIFDRYSVANLYAIDVKYTISLLKHQLKIYSISFYPIKIYLFIKIFWGYGWLIYAGVPTCIVITFTTHFFRQHIVDFILFKIFKMERKNNTKYVPETYCHSYFKYLQDLRIDEQNIISNKLLSTQ